MQRQSNIELLRIIAMSFILILHFFTKVMEISDINPYVYQSLTIANICGVNLFVMISGYFGIRGSMQSFLRLSGLIVFITAITLVIGVFTFGIPLSVGKIVKTFLMPFSVQYWFLACYLGLYILAPLVNKGLSDIHVHELRRLVIVLTFISVFSCWYGKNRIGVEGYSLFHFIYLYILGYYLHHERIPDKPTHFWLVLSFAALAVNILLTFAFDYLLGTFENRYWKENALSYNNPFAISASVFIFMFFTKLKIRNSVVINSLASTALGCYLLQESFFGKEVYQMQSEFLHSHQVRETLIMFTASFLAYWLLSYILCRSYYYCYNKTQQGIRPKMRVNLFGRK